MHWFLVHASPFTIFTVSSVSVINLLLTFIFLEHSLKISLALDWVTAYKIKSCVISSAHYLAFQTQVGFWEKIRRLNSLQFLWCTIDISGTKTLGCSAPLRFCLGGRGLRAPPAPPPMRWEGQWKRGTGKWVLKRHACGPTVRYDGWWYDSFQTIANTCNRLSRI